MKSSLKIIKRLLIVSILFSVFIINSYSVEPVIGINETNTLVAVGNGQVSVSATGVISVYNPSNVSTIYEVIIPLNLGSSVGITKVNNGNTSGEFDIEFKKVKTYLVGPGETFSTGYRIYGLVTTKNSLKIRNSNASVLEYYADSFSLASNINMQLGKIQQEGAQFDQNGTLNQTIGNTSRLIPASIRNPTDFDYFIHELRLYKTDTSNPFFGTGNVIGQVEDKALTPFNQNLIHFWDNSSNDNSVYWLSSDVRINTTIISNSSYTFRAFVPASTGGGGSTRVSNTSTRIRSLDIFEPLIVKKTASEAIVRYGEAFEVVLQVINVNTYPLYNLTLEDVIPDNYELLDISEKVRIVNATNLFFEIPMVDRFSTYIIKYTLENQDDLRGITYLKPAITKYNDEEFYSDGVLLINELLPEKKVFVQKEITYEDDEFARITIKVKNLGVETLEGILVSDLIDDSALIKEISKVFTERGVWKIERLEAGEEWEVTYLIERNANLDSLPNIFGVDKSEVFGTLVSSEEVVTIFREQPRTIEKVGMALAVGLLIFYLLF